MHITTPSELERARRYRLAEDLMDAESVAGLIAYGEAADFFTGAAVGALVVIARGQVPTVLVAPGRWPAPATPWLDTADVREALHAYGLADAVREHELDRSTVGVIGIEAFSPLHHGAAMPYTLWAEVLRLLPAVTFTPVWRPFLLLTMPHSAEEIDQLTASAAIGETATRAMVIHLRSRASLADARHAAMAAANSEADAGRTTVSVTPIAEGLLLADVATGDGRAMSHHLTAITTRLARSTAVDSAGAAARAAYDAGVELMRPGTAFGEVAEAMRREIAAAGAVHRSPQITSVPPGLVGGCGPHLPTIGYDIPLTAGMVFTVAATGQIGSTTVRLGGTVVIGADRAIELAPSTRHLIHI